MVIEILKVIGSEQMEVAKKKREVKVKKDKDLTKELSKEFRRDVRRNKKQILRNKEGPPGLWTQKKFQPEINMVKDANRQIAAD